MQPDIAKQSQLDTQRHTASMLRSRQDWQAQPMLTLESAAGRPRLLLTFFLLLGLALLATPSSAIDAGLLPWQRLGLDAEFALRHQTLLKSLSDNIKTTWLEQASDLNTRLSQKQAPVPSNTQQRAKTIALGQARDPFPRSVYLVPVLCPIGDKLVLSLQIVETETQLLLAGDQIVLPRKGWGPKEKLERTADSLQTSLRDMKVNLVTRALQTASRPSTDAMKLELRTDGINKSDEDCLTLLLSHSLAGEIRLISELGRLEGTLLRKSLSPQASAQRATRTLKLDWGAGPFRGPSYPFKARWAEAVFAGQIDPAISGEASLEASGQAMRPPNQLLQLLSNERGNLKLDELPQVVRIERAWAYLDRGRAYGLEMNDRLYLADGVRRIKAHVVGYYGPKLGLKTSSGKLIAEGAIVYIRKGQQDIKIGDRLGYDPTTFPTPWPPVPQPSR